MSTPHAPSSPNPGPAEPLEPAWNPGGRNLSYINKAGRRKIGVIGFLLCSSAHNLGADFVVAMPITSFALGTWQVYRLQWKKKLIEQYTENLRQPPIILP